MYDQPSLQIMHGYCFAIRQRVLATHDGHQRHRCQNARIAARIGLFVLQGDLDKQIDLPRRKLIEGRLGAAMRDVYKRQLLV